MRILAIVVCLCLLFVAVGIAAEIDDPSAPENAGDGQILDSKPTPDPSPGETEGSKEPSKEALPLQAEHAETDPHAEDHHDAHGEEGDHGGHGGIDLGKKLPLWSVIPFAGILLSIALFPLIAPHFWHYHFPKVSAFWAFVFALPFLAAYSDNAWLSIVAVLLPVGPFILVIASKERPKALWGGLFTLFIATFTGLFILHGVGGAAWHEILHIYIVDYIPFIILLWALYTVAGGIVVSGTLRGSPAVNTVMLLIGTIIASWIGTTGAAMVLIRPLLRANKWRRKKVHVVVFFIFLVANIGGSLTPLGDPPLFLGFLHGVSFFWTFHILPEMLVVSIILLILFFGLDSYYYRKEDPPPEDGEGEPIRVSGIYNFLFLGGIVGSVLMSGTAKLGEVNIMGVHQTIQNLLRDALLVTMGVLSLAVTPQKLRKANEFTWAPIQEVAYLFAGIFMTIIPALAILKAGSEGAFAFLVNAVNTPGQYFWATGVLSSFLDNAPTYLTFFSSAQGKLYPGVSELEAVPYLMGHVKEGVVNGSAYLAAISAGAVFMGANTYIGNAPNFMVKSIAEESGIPMPSFFGYMFKYSLTILVPLFIIVSLIFF
jgi:Na+/H+ antiporter NhaD/arsenite permease-like protein